MSWIKNLVFWPEPQTVDIVFYYVIYSNNNLHLVIYLTA